MRTARSAALVLATAVASIALASCVVSVPADPGENARLRAPLPASLEPAYDLAPSRDAVRLADDDRGARDVYLVKCARCHEPFPPTHASPAEWPAIVRKYGPRAGVFGEERERILRWLQANAR